ncbi:Helicase protein with RING/U-box domain-containing protein [Perilla frutescens var. hirtella]|nr:Helicase protein with RING/U-box domain-containing protein [Perilla frutescens var. hirtella]
MEAASTESESMEAKVKMVKSMAGSEISEADVIKALSLSNNNVLKAVEMIIDSAASCSLNPHLSTHKTFTSTGGTRIQPIQVNLSNNLGEGVEAEGISVDGLNVVKQECLSVENGEVSGVLEGEREGGVVEKCDTDIGSTEVVRVKEENVEFSREEMRDLGGERSSGQVGRSNLSLNSPEKDEEKKAEAETRVKEEHNADTHNSFDAVNQEPVIFENGEVAGSVEGERKGSVLKKCHMGVGVMEVSKVKEESDVGFVEGEGFAEEKKDLSGERSLVPVGISNLTFEEVKQEITSSVMAVIRVKEEPNVDTEADLEVTSGVKKEPVVAVENKSAIVVKEAGKQLISVQPLSARKLSDGEYKRMGYNDPKPKRVRVEETTLSSVVIEDGDFQEEPKWLLVGRNVITGLSTTKGRKVETNEIVHFSFPSANTRTKISTHFMSSKAANAASSIVRFSTKRNGEIGRLPMEWAKCLIPLVNSTKVKVLGRCVAAPDNLRLMQEILLYVSFYIHESVFTQVDKSWKLEAANIDSTVYPLLKLFKLLKVGPSQKAEFTPEELDSRKRSLQLDDDSDNTPSVLPSLKRRKGTEALDYKIHEKDEQVISESTLNKLVGAVDMYNLEEMEPPETLACDLRPYQKQALYWMSELEKGADLEKTEKTLHPCWAAYRVSDERAPEIYVNLFSGEATTEFPNAMQMARGGILADAMGLGKTVMTIALILARRGRGIQEGQQVTADRNSENINNRQRNSNSLKKQKGGTLIVCPMALLSQWKDELEAHSKSDSITIFVHYGGDRTDDPRVIAEPDVVLTTYGVLTASYKSENVNSIYHRVEWHRVVLDEAHTIKSSKTQAAQAAFALSSHCRWCLTGTPLQNSLEDLFSLLCFLRVEPWCNWAWWNKLIQKPYENGDQRGLKLVKAILRPLMLRRSKESKDKQGRPILVLPPTDVQVIECEQSETEQDFYDALYRRSKVQFDQFVAQGKVLHNYANILELLLRLRQCCNHPFLVMSRGDTAEYADLNKLARRFLQSHSDAGCGTGPSRAYVEEVVEGLRSGEHAECPICLESADDPVLTPCAHRMCRECLLSSWRTPAAGVCPICRKVISKSDLITCPSGGKFRIDVEKNWKESSKISKLLDCLEKIRSSGSGEKSIVFSQWTSFLDLLEIPLRRRNLGFLRFDGKLAQKQRGKVLHEFAETTEKTILLMSLKAGGVGLNLTAASNVFLMDPWWNPAVEEQAIMRIHRIGQKLTVRVRRFIVKNTVEERMQQVQARKQRMIAGALTDEEVRSTRLEELKMLFR